MNNIEVKLKLKPSLMQSVNSDESPCHSHLSRPNKTTLKSFEQAKNGDFKELSIEELMKKIKTKKVKQKKQKTNLRDFLLQVIKIDDLEIIRSEGKAREIELSECKRNEKPKENSTEKPSK